MTDAELDAMEARCKAATPGPWCLKYEGPFHKDPPHFERVIHGGSSSEVFDLTSDDWGFLVRARTDLPRVVAELRQLRRLAREAPTELVIFCRDATSDPTADGVAALRRLKDYCDRLATGGGK